MASCSSAWLVVPLLVFFLAKKILFFRRFGHGRGWGRGPGQSHWLRALFRRLDTTPGQEREIRGAFEDLRVRARGAREGLRAGREGLGRALRGEVLDEEALHDLHARAEVAAGELRSAVDVALRRVHAVLDSHQRERLAAFLERAGRGPWGAPFGGGPYRG